MPASRLLFLIAAAAAAQAAPRPNLLFIITDEQSADALSCRMGSRYLHTPAEDSLAARGTFFTRAYAANPLCMPSRNSMFTGHYPHRTGVMANDPVDLDRSGIPGMGTYFLRAGYDTAYCGKWHLCYDPSDVAAHGFETRQIGMLDAATATHAIGFLRRRHDRPFLLVASFLNPHNICEYPRGQPLSNGPIGAPPPPAELPPPPANLAPPWDEPDSMALISEGYHASPQFPVGGYTPLDWRRYRWGYYRLVEKSDDQIGRVLAALRSLKLDRDTVVVFTSDHGDCAGAHGLNQKTVLYEEAARVPLIVCLPGGGGPRVSDRLVNTGVDLLPTFLDFAGLPKPAALPGRSLRPLARGRPAPDWPDQVVVEDDMTQAGLVDGFVPMTQGRMVRTARYKYCVYAYGRHRESLVDLQSDPGEMVNLARDPSRRAVLLEMRERLRRFGAATGDTEVEKMLADDVGPVPFPRVKKPRRNRGGRRAGPVSAPEPAAGE